MKKLHKISRTLFLLVFILFFSFQCVFAYAKSIDSTQWDYPISISDPGYAELSIDEIIALCQMPKNLLSATATERLVELVLRYPLLINYIAAFNTFSIASQSFAASSNIYCELLTREDALSEMLKAYCQLSIDTDVFLNPDEEDYILPLTNSNLKAALFLEEFILENYDLYSKQQKSLFMEKRDGISQLISSLSSSNNPIYVISGNQASGFTASGSLTIFRQLDNGNYEYVYPGTYSLWNLSETCYQHQSGEYSSTYIYNSDTEFDNANPYMNRITSTTCKFNCHSYAWISTNTSTNKYWVDSLSSWPSGKTYVGTNCSASYGDIIVIKSGSLIVHSAVVTSGGTNSNSITVKAKMGVLGVASSALSTMISYYSGTTYYVYR